VQPFDLHVEATLNFFTGKEKKKNQDSPGSMQQPLDKVYLGTSASLNRNSEKDTGDEVQATLLEPQGWAAVPTSNTATRSKLFFPHSLSPLGGRLF